MHDPKAIRLFVRASREAPRNRYLQASLDNLTKHYLSGQFCKLKALRLLANNARDYDRNVTPPIARDFADLVLTAWQNGRI